MVRVIASVAEATGLIGEVLGESEGLVLTQTRIDQFADATGDRQWIHVDPERAANGPFGATIAHGYLTLALVPLFASEIYRMDFGDARLNYGLNRVRFPSTVPVGSTVRGTARITDVTASAAGTLVTTEFTMRADGQERPVCVAEALVMVIGADAGSHTPETSKEAA